MTELASGVVEDPPYAVAEVARLKKVVRSLMDRAERSTNLQGSDFSLFQTGVMLEEQVRRRTEALETALRENEKVNRALCVSEAKFRGMVGQSLVGIVITEDGKFSYSNAKFNEIFGYSEQEIRALSPADIVAEEDRPLVAEKIRQRMSGEVERVMYMFHGLHKSGAVLDIETHAGVMEVAGKREMISVVMDVTERTRAEHALKVLQERLSEQATRDALTGLYNRRYLEEALARELTLAEREGHPVSVIMGDLDHFKAVNDHYGHLAGDEVLRAFAAILKRQVRGSDIYCRYGGEEFLLVLPWVPEAVAVKRAEQLRIALSSSPIDFHGTQIAVTASFGVATFPRHASTGEDLIAAADTALYAAKEGGRNRVEVGVASTRSSRSRAVRAVG